MKRSQRRLLALMVAIPLLVVTAALIYMLGMAQLEGSPRGFWQSVEWAAETLSTTGYGADSKWVHPLMVTFVVLVQFIGVFLVFLIIPIYLVPFLEERFEERLPRHAPPEIRDHVIVYRYGPSVETVIEQLGVAAVRSVIIERDEQTARSLLERGLPVAFVREEDDVLQACNLGQARAIVANGRDEENGALILRARQRGFKGPIYALVEEPAHRRPMELAGATAAYTPRHILAAALAARASEQITPPVYGVEQISGFELRHFRVRRDSAQAGKPIDRSSLAALGISVPGVWIRGALLTQELADVPLPADAILLLLGPAAALDDASKIESLVALPPSGLFLIAGFGEVGAKVSELLTDAGESVRSIDRHPSPKIDLVGNVLDPELLRRAGIETARAIILALDSDDATMFATVIAREVAPNIPIIARVNHARNVENIFTAGADFALSIAEVSGQMLSHRLLRKESSTHTAHLQIVRLEGAEVEGLTLRQIAQARGCTVVGVERAGALLSPAAVETVAAGEAVYLCGTADAFRRK